MKLQPFFLMLMAAMLLMTAPVVQAIRRAW